MASYALQLRNDQLDRITAYAGAGALLRIYSGDRPATGGALVAGNVKLSEHILGTPFAPAAVDAVLSPTLPADANGLADGQGAWFRVVRADGSTFVIDGSVGTSAADLILNTLTISTGVAVKVTGMTITRGNA